MLWESTTILFCATVRPHNDSASRIASVSEAINRVW